MLYAYRTALSLVAAPAILLSLLASAAAQEREPRKSLVELGSYGGGQHDPGPLADLLSAVIEGTAHRSTVPLASAVLARTPPRFARETAQEEAGSAWRPEGLRPGAPSPQSYLRPAFGVGNEITASLFATRIDGHAADAPGHGQIDFSDLFDPGSGLELAWHLHLEKIWSPGRIFSWGPLVMLSHARFDGGDPVSFVEYRCNSTIEADSMTITKMLGGVHMRKTSGGFFFGFHLGLGVAIISSMDAERVDEGVGLTGCPDATYDVELFSQTSTLAFALGGRLGWRWESSGHRIAVGIQVPLGIGFNGGPRDGDTADDIDPGGPMIGWHAGLGLSLEFGGG